ncbi:hypothetical protein GH733_006596 [Mirounga leonina]|nr:hypothetical protein GH733_006596 [Mirounga leonina]
MVSYTLKDIHNNQHYLHSLGKAPTAQVQKLLGLGESEAKRDSEIQEATTKQEKAQYLSGMKMARVQEWVVEQAHQVAVQKQEITPEKELEEAPRSLALQAGALAKAEKSQLIMQPELDMQLEELPQVAQEISSPLTLANKITLVSSGSRGCRDWPKCPRKQQTS